MQILLVEDDPHIQTLLQFHFSREKWRVITCASAEEALKEFEEKTFELVVVDWMLAGHLSGLDLCKRLAHKVRILMLTSRNEPTDIVSALENGADDYVAKPFEPAVLIARIRAILRRSVDLKQTADQVLRIKDLEVYPNKFEVKCKGKLVELTPSEFGVLVALLENPGCVMSRQNLLAKTQGTGINVVERTIDTHVYTLRKKIGTCGDCIETIRGVGYRVHHE